MSSSFSNCEWSCCTMSNCLALSHLEVTLTCLHTGFCPNSAQLINQMPMMCHEVCLE